MVMMRDRFYMPGDGCGLWVALLGVSTLEPVTVQSHFELWRG